MITTCGIKKDKWDEQEAEVTRVLSSKVWVKFLTGPCVNDAKDFPKTKLRLAVEPRPEALSDPILGPSSSPASASSAAPDAAAGAANLFGAMVLG